MKTLPVASHCRLQYGKELTPKTFQLYDHHTLFRRSCDVSPTSRPFLNTFTLFLRVYVHALACLHCKRDALPREDAANAHFVNGIWKRGK